MILNFRFSYLDLSSAAITDVHHHTPFHPLKYCMLEQASGQRQTDESRGRDLPEVGYFELELWRATFYSAAEVLC